MRVCQYLGLCSWLLFASQALAQNAGDRARTWEAGFHLVDMSSVLVSGRFGSSVDVDSDIGYGFTGGYNFTNRFALMLDANWSAPNYLATFAPDGSGSPATVSTRLDVATIQAKGVFHFFESDLTPFVEVGFGWTNVDSNIIEGPPITDCWWDYFWGYVCRNFFETYSQTNRSYSAGIGIRWDMSEDFMMRGSLGTLELDLDAAGNDPSVDTIQFDFSWRF